MIDRTLTLETPPARETEVTKEQHISQADSVEMLGATAIAALERQMQIVPEENEKDAAAIARNSIQEFLERSKPENNDDRGALREVCGLDENSTREETNQAIIRNAEYEQFRAKDTEAMTVVVKYLEEGQDVAAIRKIIYEFSEAINIDTGELSDNFVETLKDKLNEGDDDKKQRQAEDIAEKLKKTVEHVRPVSFKTFSEAANAGIDKEKDLREYHENRRKTYSELIEVMDELLPETNTPRWESIVEVELDEEDNPEKPYENWKQKVSAAGITPPKGCVDLRYRKLTTKKKFRRKKVAKSSKDNISTEKASAILIAENGNATQKKVFTAELQAKKKVWLSEHMGIPPGDAFANDRQVEVTTATKRINNIVEAQDEYDRIMSAAIIKDSKGKSTPTFAVPTITMKDGAIVETWELWDNTKLMDWREAVRKSKESFEKAGFDYETEKRRRMTDEEERTEQREKARKLLHIKLNETRAEASNWIDQERAKIAIRGGLNEIKNLADGPPEDTHLISQMESVMRENELIMQHFGYMDKNRPEYIRLAEEKALAELGGDMNTPEFKELVSQKLEEIIAENEYKKSIVFELGSEISELMRIIESSNSQDAITRAKKQLRELAANMDYEVEIRLYAKLGMTVIEGADTDTLKTQIREAFSFVTRPGDELIRKERQLVADGTRYAAGAEIQAAEKLTASKIKFSNELWYAPENRDRDYSQHPLQQEFNTWKANLENLRDALLSDRRLSSHQEHTLYQKMAAIQRYRSLSALPRSEDLTRNEEPIVEKRLRLAKAEEYLRESDRVLSELSAEHERTKEQKDKGAAGFWEDPDQITVKTLEKDFKDLEHIKDQGYGPNRPIMLYKESQEEKEVPIKPVQSII